MAFSTTYLSSAGGQSKRGKAPAEFTYQTTDSLATILAAGYIGSPNHTLFKIGDLIRVNIVDNADTPTQVIQLALVQVGAISSAGSVSLNDVTAGYQGGVIRIPVFFNQTDLLAGTTQFMPCPVAGTIKRLISTVQIQVTTGGALGLTVDGTAVPGLSITVADGATVGTTQSDTPSSATRCAAGDALGFTASAGFATAGAVHCIVEIVPDVDNGDLFIPFFFNQTDLLAGTSQWWPIPIEGSIVGLHTAVQLAVTTGGAIAVELETVAVTDLSITIADAATAGTVQSDTISGAAVARNVDAEITAASAFATAGAVNGLLQVRPTNKADTHNRAFVWFSANETDVLAATSHYSPNGLRGYVLRGVTAVQLAVGTGGNVVPELGNVAVAGLTVVVANSAPVGDIDADNATANDDTALIADVAAIETTFQAAFATTGALNGVWEVQALL
jgi:hypothetical protein